ncbi:L,D-transpeptidase family protein [Persephonella sp.]
MNILKAAAAVLSLLFVFTTTFGSQPTIEDVLKQVENKNIDKAEELARQLPYEERIKLNIILLLQEGKKKEAERLFSKIKDIKKGILENVLYLPDGTYAIVVSKSRQKLKVIKMENDVPVEVLELRSITGKRPGDKLKEGDQRTPNGVYLPVKYLTKLAPMYGVGAFPLNYPNILDRKFLNKTGNGIWIHASDKPDRPNFSSNGCVVLNNDNFNKLRRYIKLKDTPVVIVEDFEYTDPKSFKEKQMALIYFVYQWKRAWEETAKGKLDNYFLLYSDRFVSKKGNKRQWIKYKTRISKQKDWIKISIKNLSILKDGRMLDFGNIYVAVFDMDYRSNNYNFKGKKILYIIREKGKWKILAEETL